LSIRIRRLSEEPGEDEDEEGFQGVNSVWVVLKRTDLMGLSSRIFRIEPKGHTGMHSHNREHIAVIIRGVCRVETGERAEEVSEGGIVTVPSGKLHRFSNPGREKLVILIMNLFTEAKTVAGGEL
jgi:quercetin dioxygenase-like cupin family protein